MDTPDGDRSPVVDEPGFLSLPPQYGDLQQYQSSHVQPAGPSPVAATPAVGHYRVDPERAPEVIAAFRKAAEDMLHLRERALQLGEIPPPGVDGVSLNAVREIGDWAVGPEGSLQAALQQGAASLQTAADNLRAQLDAFLGAEEANTMRSDGSAL